MSAATNAPIQNLHIMYRSDPLPEYMRLRPLSLAYAPHVTSLLMHGLSITYGEEGKQVVEYPDGRKIEVRRRSGYDDDSVFERYHFDILGELTLARRWAENAWHPQIQGDSHEASRRHAHDPH